MIKNTKIGTLKTTGEAVFQTDAGDLRVFKTLSGKEVAISEIKFFHGPIAPAKGKAAPEKTVVEPVERETPEQDEESAATVELMEEVNEDQGYF